LARGLKPGHLIYTHDELHELVKYGDQPIYEGLKLDPSKAKLERTLFEQLPYEQQLQLVREEAMAICTERMVIPQLLAGKKPNVQAIYNVGLSMVLTTLSKGWFRNFGIEHWPDVRVCDRDLVRIIAEDGRLNLPQYGDQYKQYGDQYKRTSFGASAACPSPSLTRLGTPMTLVAVENAVDHGAESDCSIEEISAADVKMMGAQGMMTIDATLLQVLLPLLFPLAIPPC
jgi:hypothetical protein